MARVIRLQGRWPRTYAETGAREVGTDAGVRFTETSAAAGSTYVPTFSRAKDLFYLRQ